MTLPIRIVSTDFDGTLHADNEDPPIPANLEALIGRLQSQGVTWVINTGRDLSSLMESLGRARLSIWPDYVVTVEREIHCREDSKYVGIEEWNPVAAGRTRKFSLSFVLISRSSFIGSTADFMQPFTRTHTLRSV
jgi:hypothetical protein